MYERSAIVLEKFFNDIFGFNKKVNLKNLFKNYKEMMAEIEKYQGILREEDKIISEFDEVANEIRRIQQEQKKLYNSSIKLEEERNQLFDSLDEEPKNIEKKLRKIEETIIKNNKRCEELREGFITALTNFGEKQKERNKFSRIRRTEEKEYLRILDKCKKDISEIDINTLKRIKKYYNSDNDAEKNEISDIMITNGKDEKVPFNRDVIELSIEIRSHIAKEEAFCYMTIYERTKKILSEVNGDEIKLDKYQKSLRDVSVKLAFLKAQKSYIVSFLDNERMTAIYGVKVHKQLMNETCNDFEVDMEQFNNLYELIGREISGKADDKDYLELYNKEYLKKIKEKEQKFEKEINSININTGAIMNSNFWRIEEIKNVYEVFQKEVSEKFNKDISELKIDESELEIDENAEYEDEIFKVETPGEVVEYLDEYDLEYDDYEDFSNDPQLDLDEKEDFSFETNDDEDEYEDLSDKDDLDLEDDEDDYLNSEYDKDDSIFASSNKDFLEDDEEDLLTDDEEEEEYFEDYDYDEDDDELYDDEDDTEIDLDDLEDDMDEENVDEKAILDKFFKE